MQEAKFFRGHAGEILRPAACLFIQKLSVSKVFDQVDTGFLDICQQFLNECLEYNNPQVQVNFKHFQISK
jgi:hypothetical protein